VIRTTAHRTDAPVRCSGCGGSIPAGELVTRAYVAGDRYPCGEGHRACAREDAREMINADPDLWDPDGWHRAAGEMGWTE